MNSVVSSESAIRSHPSTTYLAVVAVFLGLVNGLLIVFAQHRIPLNGRFVAAALCLNLYLALFFLLGNRALQSQYQLRLRQKSHSAWLVPGLLIGGYGIYALGTESLQPWPALKLVIYAFSPTALLLASRRSSDRLQWQDALAVLALWLPLDFRWTQDAWGWPRHSLAYSMNSLLATCLAVFLFVGLRRLGGIGYHFHFGLTDWEIGCRNFLCFAPIAIPIGILTGFLQFSNRFSSVWHFLPEFLLSVVGIFIFIAIPEELLFRGIIQNFLQKTWFKPLPALIVTSILFGAAHLNNGPNPDWRYFLLASIAGLFYGNAYLRTGALLAPAIVHALVDAVWRSFFR